MMNAAETVQKAIERLETLKAKATSGEWWPSDTGAVFAGPGLSDDVAVAYEVRLRGDVKLIVALHRTIDAQIELLRWFADSLANDPGSEPPARSEHLELALAILGSDSR